MGIHIRRQPVPVQIHIHVAGVRLVDEALAVEPRQVL